MEVVNCKSVLEMSLSKGCVGMLRRRIRLLWFRLRSLMMLLVFRFWWITRSINLVGHCFVTCFITRSIPISLLWRIRLFFKGHCGSRIVILLLWSILIINKLVLSRLMIPPLMGWVVPLYHLNLLQLLSLLFPPFAVIWVAFPKNCWYYKKSTRPRADYIVCRNLYLRPPTLYLVSFHHFNFCFLVFVLVACLGYVLISFFHLCFQKIWLAKVAVVMFTEDVFQMARNWLWKFWSHLKTW